MSGVSFPRLPVSLSHAMHRFSAFRDGAQMEFSQKCAAIMRGAEKDMSTAVVAAKVLVTPKSGNLAQTLSLLSPSMP